MKTTQIMLPIEERLKSQEFLDKLSQHPIIKKKNEQAKKDLAAMKATEQSKSQRD